MRRYKTARGFDCLRCETPSFEATGEWVHGIAIVPFFALPVLFGLLVFIFRFKSDSNPHILLYSLRFSRQRSGSFPEQSNKMNERSVSWRQTIKLSIFITESRLENRVAAGVTKKVRSLKWPGEVIRGLKTLRRRPVLGLVVKTTNLEAQTCMDTGVWFRYLLIYKG